MKRKIIGLAAIVLALSLSAFNARPSEKKFASYWWFPLNSAGQAQCISHLVYQSFDPTSCTNWGWGGYCEGAFDSYSGSFGNYCAAGDEVGVDFVVEPF